MAVPFSVPTCDVWVICFSSSMPAFDIITVLFFDIWIGMSWCLTAVLICFSLTANKGIPSDWVVKNPSTNAGDVGSLLGLRRSSGGENGNPLQYYCLGNLMDREAWQAIVCGVTKDSNMAWWLKFIKWLILFMHWDNLSQWTWVWENPGR